MSKGLVLVTGGSGFIGLYTVRDILANGFDILAVVRNESRTSVIKKIAAEFPDRKVIYEYVADMGTEGAFDEPLKKHQDVKYIVHLATSFSGEALQLVDTTVDGVNNLLWSAKKYGPNVQRFVFTSSNVVFTDTTRTSPNPPKVITEESWVPFEKEFATKGSFQAYIVSKKFAEQAFWQFLEKEKPQFDGIAVAPSLTIGETIGPAKTLKEMGVSINMIHNIITGGTSQDSYSSISHVKDIAKAHRVALTSKHGGSRWLPTLPFIFHKQLVELAGIAKPDPKIDTASAFIPQFDHSKTDREIGFELIPVEVALKETLADLRKRGIIN